MFTPPTPVSRYEHAVTLINDMRKHAANRLIALGSDEHADATSLRWIQDEEQMRVVPECVPPPTLVIGVS
jgi:hypothetical protein